MKALWTGVAFIALVMGCSGGSGPVTVVDPGPSADEVPSTGGSAGSKGTTGGGTSGNVCDQAIEKLKGECGITDVGGPAGCTQDKDKCIAGCILDAPCDEVTDLNQDNGFYDCLADCPM